MSPLIPNTTQTATNDGHQRGQAQKGHAVDEYGNGNEGHDAAWRSSEPHFLDTKAVAFAAVAHASLAEGRLYRADRVAGVAWRRVQTDLGIDVRIDRNERHATYNFR